jgi:hypothetical protein
VVNEVCSVLRLSKRKTRVGRISRIRDKDVLVEGLASSKRVAESLSGMEVITAKGCRGTIAGPFGTRGVLSVVFEESVSDSEEVFYERFVEEEIEFGR